MIVVSCTVIDAVGEGTATCHCVAFGVVRLIVTTSLPLSLAPRVQVTLNDFADSFCSVTFVGLPAFVCGSVESSSVQAVKKENRGAIRAM